MLKFLHVSSSSSFHRFPNDPFRGRQSSASLLCPSEHVSAEKRGRTEGRMEGRMVMDGLSGRNKPGRFSPPGRGGVSLGHIQTASYTQTNLCRWLSGRSHVVTITSCGLSGWLTLLTNTFLRIQPQEITSLTLHSLRLNIHLHHCWKRSMALSLMLWSCFSSSCVWNLHHMEEKMQIKN